MVHSSCQAARQLARTSSPERLKLYLVATSPSSPHHHPPAPVTATPLSASWSWTFSEPHTICPVGSFTGRAAAGPPCSQAGPWGSDAGWTSRCTYTPASSALLRGWPPGLVPGLGYCDWCCSASGRAGVSSTCWFRYTSSGIPGSLGHSIFNSGGPPCCLPQGCTNL